MGGRLVEGGGGMGSDCWEKERRGEENPEMLLSGFRKGTTICFNGIPTLYQGGLRKVYTFRDTINDEASNVDFVLFRRYFHREPMYRIFWDKYVSQPPAWTISSPMLIAFRASPSARNLVLLH